jgi:hypothetical protein
VPGAQCFGTLTWSYMSTGEKVASISHEASLVDPDDAWMKLRYSVNLYEQDYRVALVTSHCH